MDNSCSNKMGNSCGKVANDFYSRARENCCGEKMDNFSGRPVGVLGLGKSGVASARYLAGKGAVVFAGDSKPPGELGDVPAILKNKGIQLEFGKHSWDFFSKCELIVVSPGIPLKNSIITEALQRKVPVISEIELAYRVCPAPIVAVTGTNGKSTTVSLIGHLINCIGRKSVVAGNIGTPLLDLISEVTSSHFVVMEVSSFQLETIVDFKPQIAVFLNFTPDHLNRHYTIDEYFAAKMRLFKNQTSHDIAILNHDDEEILRCAAQIKSKILWFSLKDLVSTGSSLIQDTVVVTDDDGMKPLCKRNIFPYPGEHNTQNLLAAITVLSALKLPLEGVPDGLAAFKGLPHRLEFVETIDGVSFYDDSKGTNPDATAYAIKSMETSVILIAGGSNKGFNLKPISDAGKGKIKGVVAIGETSKDLLLLFNYLSSKQKLKGESLKDAILKAKELAVPGDAILLSPGCASFDMFKNAEDRGEQFQSLVHKLFCHEVVRDNFCNKTRRDNFCSKTKGKIREGKIFQ